MPERPQRPQRGSQESANASARQRPQRTEATQPQQGGNDDAWDSVMKMKQPTGEAGGFNKMNTNFYLKNGEEIELVMLDEDPKVFWGHAIKCKSSKGSTFYRIEQCQKSIQGHCVMCDSDNKAIGKAKQIISFRVLDSRGSWKKDIGNGQSGMDGVPAPKIFLTPLYLAKQFKTLKDDGEGVITDKVLKLKKDDKYMASFYLTKSAGGLNYVSPPDFDGDMPETLDVYAPMEDDELIDFITQFADAPANVPQANRPQAGGGRASSGSFGS